ncbi:hypothetical protein Tco_0551718 [Tanacetum coccineum]
MAYFRSLHSHLQVLSKEDLKGSRIELGFKRAFMSLFGQDDDTFTSMMFLNVDQLQKQLDKDEFQEDGSMAAFWTQTQESNVDTGKALDANLVVTESNGTELESWKVYSILCSTNNSNGENQVVSKYSAVPTADASDKRQQQPDSTSSTSTLAITVTTDGNFDL